MLDQINTSHDVKKLDLEELEKLCQEIREEILSTVSKTGGHLASSLGVVEMTTVLHYVFDFPKDKVVWDVGHQSYAHKLLTGRRDRFHTLRQYEGISGFPKRDESPYDTFDSGHSGTSISSALGMAEARRLKGEEGRVIAVIGDGSLTAGLAFEGLNQAGHIDQDLIVSPAHYGVGRVTARMYAIVQLMVSEVLERLVYWNTKGLLKLSLWHQITS